MWLSISVEYITLYDIYIFIIPNAYYQSSCCMVKHCPKVRPSLNWSNSLNIFHPPVFRNDGGCSLHLYRKVPHPLCFCHNHGRVSTSRVLTFCMVKEWCCQTALVILTASDKYFMRQQSQSTDRLIRVLKNLIFRCIILSKPV